MDKWAVLSTKMRRENEAGEEVFMNDRLTPESLKAAYDEGIACIEEIDGVIVGYVAVWPTGDPGFVEPGSFYVEPGYRDHKIGSRLFSAMLKIVPAGKQCMIVSHNPKVVALCLKHGFVEATKETWYSDAPYKEVCVPCDRDVGDKLTCPYRAVKGKCQLLVC